MLYSGTHPIQYTLHYLRRIKFVNFTHRWFGVISGIQDAQSCLRSLQMKLKICLISLRVKLDFQKCVGLLCLNVTYSDV